MNNTGYFDETEVRKAIQQLKPDGEVFEIRIPGMGVSGYFKDADHLITAFNTVNLREQNVYITVNRVKPELLSRSASERFKKVKETTNDGEIEYYEWLFIDLDPDRPKGISSTDEELQKSYELAKQVYQYLRNLGFEEPIKAVSGNGAHLLYSIALENNEENKTLLSECLQALDAMFSNEYVHIDIVNFNPSRICKLYGTLAQKGSNTAERPHRMSKIIGDVREVKPTKKAYLQKLADAIPHEEIKPQQYNNYSPATFEIRDWMAKHSIQYVEKPYKNGIKFVLKECPFNSNHKSPDSAIFQLSSGAIGFKCMHNSCFGKTWQDVRKIYEPEAYERAADDRDRRIEEGWRKHNANNQKIIYTPRQVETPEAPMFQTAAMILSKPEKVRTFVQSGIWDIDKKLMGLEKGCVSIVSGLRGSAKSTVLSVIALNAINTGATVLFYSGELTDTNFLRWMMLQAAGKNYTVKSEKYENYYTVPLDIQKKIASWLGERLWLYNNEYGNKFNQIYEAIRSKAEEHKADLIVIDNLMALELDGADKDKYEAQKRFVWNLKNLAILSNTHVIFVAHPRKALGFLRLDDVSGSGDLTNIVDNAFIVHRNNHDFHKATQIEFTWRDDNPIYSSTNVIEICKSREGGMQDEFIPLWYEPSTKRLKNEITEYVHYGWEPTNEGFIDVPEGADIPFS